MNKYVAVFIEPLSEERHEEIKQIPQVEDTFEVAENVLLFTSPMENPITLSDLIGLDESKMTTSQDDQSHIGVIFKLNGFYGGYFYKNLWKWLKEA